MSLIGKLLGRHAGDPYAEGIALFEAGRFAEAAERLRGATSRQRGTGAGSLAAFYRRQALTGEGRRLLREGRAAAAIPFLSEAAAEWDRFPDLLCLLGLSQALAGAWGDALATAGQALRCNPDYIEARLLEAAALARLGRPRDAAASLDKLCESGRRVDHALIDEFARPEGYDAATLPSQLEEWLTRLADGPIPDADMASAIALCRAGRWEDGVAGLRQLCVQRPHWPDYRVKLAAALFQTDRNDEALTEVDCALALNPRYGTAATLKALVLADQGRFVEARAVMQAHPPQPATGGNPHEALFAAYLAAVLALLTGCCEEALRVLAAYDDLTLTFPRGELARAAAEDLLGRETNAAQRLAALVAAWPADADYAHLHACQLMRGGDLAAAERALGRWPAWEGDVTDHRPLLLAAQLAVARGRRPAAPEVASEPDVALALRYLALRAQAQRGEWAQVETQVALLWRDGWRTERVALLYLSALAARGDGGSLSADWTAPTVVPESALTQLIWLLNSAGRVEEALEVCRRHRILHGEDLRWHWLWPPFWLAPVRRWIG